MNARATKCALQMGSVLPRFSGPVARTCATQHVCGQPVAQAPVLSKAAAVSSKWRAGRPTQRLLECGANAAFTTRAGGRLR
jgi:hypothetical protein